MIANVNLNKILQFTYTPKKIAGKINAVKWELLEKKRITNQSFEFVFHFNIDKRGGSISGTMTLITGDIDVQKVAEVCFGKYV
jgi:hypothetical protein